RVLDFAGRQAKLYRAENEALIERVEDYLIFHTGLGTMANQALSRLLAHLIVVFLGRSINVRSSPYFIMLDGAKGIDIEQFLGRIKEAGIEIDIENAVKETDLFRYKFVNVAKL